MNGEVIFLNRKHFISFGNVTLRLLDVWGASKIVGIWIALIAETSWGRIMVMSWKAFFSPISRLIRRDVVAE